VLWISDPYFQQAAETSKISSETKSAETKASETNEKSLKILVVFCRFLKLLITQQAHKSLVATSSIGVEWSLVCTVGKNMYRPYCTR